MKFPETLAPQQRIIEPLEARIAPAIVLIGAPSSLHDINDTHYVQGVDIRPAPFNLISFVDTSTATDAISLAVDSPATTNTFYLSLTAGDTVRHYTNANNYQDLIVVKNGRVIAFFTDANNNNEYDDGELTGLSLGPGASVEIDGSVNGDIVTNLNVHKTATPADDTIAMNGPNTLVDGKQTITQLNVLGGSVFGKVLTGGDIKSINIAGNVQGIYAGSAANGQTFDFFTVAGGEGVANITPLAGQNGASITNAVVKSVTDRIAAGGGGAGGTGGSLTNIQITADSDGLSLIAGPGGNADFAVKKSNGGAGGNLSGILIAGTIDTTPNSTVLVEAGAGGDGLSTGRGGVGGFAKNVQIGYELNGTQVIPSTNLLADDIAVVSGAGGAGMTGGAGGLVSAVKIRVNTPDVNGNEIEVDGGAGGASISPTGTAGIGGSINTVEVRNQITTFNADTYMHAGNGGTTIGDGHGVAGGSISNVSLLGYNVTLVAGDGSDGKMGGAGGSITSVGIIQDDFILNQNLLLDAGRGGNGSGGNGGNAGSVSKITVGSADYESFQINDGLAGNGGASIGGKGGNGGAISAINVTDVDSGLGRSGIFNIRAGNGGNGDKGGGIGGALATLTFDGVDMQVNALAGNGGNAVVKGNGGAGGAVTTTLFHTQGKQPGNLDATGLVMAGTGGTGIGAGGAGGAGGNVSGADLRVIGDGTILAGVGGSGQLDAIGVKGGAAGRGGSIQVAGIFSENGSGDIGAGSAGALGAKPGAGGSIIGGGSTLIGIRAAVNITATAGDGTAGGAGGDIRGLTYGSPSNTLLPTPSGNILVQAGDGSQGATSAGKGGTIDTVQGSASSTAGNTVIFAAGKGGGDVKTPNGGGGFTYTGSGKSAVGGSLTNVVLSRGGATGVLFTVTAGDGGHSGTGTGSKGGDVRSVYVNNITADTIFRSIGAGDGGDGLKVGGLGGSISDIHVQGHSIGVMTGQLFGYTTMGGIFAGAGGLGTKAGLAGSVTNVTADSIATIVAGKTLTPQLVEKADAIDVNGSQLLLAKNGAFAANSPFILTYNGQQTTQIPGNATAAQVQNALNLVPNIANDGGVTVTYTSDGGYSIIFGSTQTTTTAPLLNASSLQAALNSLPTVQVHGGVSVVPDPGGLKISYGASSVVIATNPSAATLAAALNSLSLSTLGKFTVDVLPNTNFQINLAAIGFGNKNQITGSESVPVDVSELIRGSVTNLAATEIQAGQFGLSVTEKQPGSTGLVTIETVHGDTFFTANEIAIGDGATTHEVQQISLIPLNAFPTGVFTLTFNGETTNQISDTGSDAQIASDIETELNNLNSVQVATGGLGVVVTPSAQLPRVFNVTYQDFANQPPITGDYLVPDTQRLDLTAVAAIAGSKFTLSFNGDTTDAPPLATALMGTATAAQIQAALDNLNAIQLEGGVTVAAVGNSGTIFDITFSNTVGSEPAIDGLTYVPEVQTLKLGTLPASANGKFHLTFDAPGTLVNETTPDLAATATASDIQTALNNLDSVKNTGAGGTGAVSVTKNPDGSFQIAFTQLGQQNGIVGTGLIQESQALNLSGATSVATGEFTITVNQFQPLPVTEVVDTPTETQHLDITALAGANTFTLTFGTDTTVALPKTATDVDIANALNLLPSITAEGGVFVNFTGGFGFDIQFTSTVDEPSIVANGLVKIGTTARLAHDATLVQIKAALDAVAPNIIDSVTADPTVGTFDVLFKNIGGQPLLTATDYVHEQQKLDVLDIGNFILRYNNAPTGTLAPPPLVPNPYNIDPGLQASLDASALAVQNALNALIPGGVTVKAGLDTSFIVTFNADGNQTLASGTQTEIMPVNTVLDGSITGAEIQEVHYFVKNQIDPAHYAVANVVGAIADLNERNANVFHYVEVNGVPGFNPGDTPLDGIIMAKIFNQKNANFIPEAKFTAAGFFDNDNIL